MLAKVTACAMVRVERVIIEVEVDISYDLPSFTIVGLADTAVQEATKQLCLSARDGQCSPYHHAGN